MLKTLFISALLFFGFFVGCGLFMYFINVKSLNESKLDFRNDSTTSSNQTKGDDQIAAEEYEKAIQKGVVFSEDKKTIQKAPKELGDSFRVPGGVTKIEEGAFVECENLKEVSIPKICSYKENSFPEGCKVTRRD